MTEKNVAGSRHRKQYWVAVSQSYLVLCLFYFYADKSSAFSSNSSCHFSPLILSARLEKLDKYFLNLVELNQIWIIITLLWN